MTFDDETTLAEVLDELEVALRKAPRRHLTLEERTTRIREEIAVLMHEHEGRSAALAQKHGVRVKCACVSGLPIMLGCPVHDGDAEPTGHADP